MDIFGFWLFLSTLVAAALYSSVNKRNTKHETLRALIARGEQADAALIDELLREGRAINPLAAWRWFRIAATLVAFVALGLAAMAGVMHASDPESTVGLLATAGLCLSVAAGLFVASLISKNQPGGEG